MQYFDSNGVRIAFLEEGAGDPVLLIHGFASNARTNWIDTGWVNSLVGSGRRVIAMDNRGHGDSDKLHDPAVYGAPMMAEDAYRLLKHLEIDQADVMGYSMGSRITAFLALAHPERVRSMVFGGLGIGMVKGVGNSAPIAEALEALDINQVVDPVARTFRSFAESTGSDLLALAACIRSARRKVSAAELAGVDIPTLVAVGTKDEIAGSPQELAALIAGAKVLDIPNRDHMRAVGDRVYKQGVLDFLHERA